MLRKTFAVAVLTVVVASASMAEAGIFFRRGGCPGGQCGVVYTMPAAQAQATAQAKNAPPAATAQTAAAPADKSPSQNSQDPQDSNAKAQQTSANPAPVYRRVGFLRRIARAWR
jgi:hypothetical protein